MSRHSVLFALLSFAHLSHFFRTDVASHCWHSHIWHSHSCLIRTVDPFALLAFALLASHWCRSHFCLSHSCRTSKIGNRKGDCAWSCSRWQTQPEIICKLQSTNQYNVRSEWHWFVRCDLQIFSGCVCHLEQPHAQSPFLFPILLYAAEPWSRGGHRLICSCQKGTSHKFPVFL